MNSASVLQAARGPILLITVGALMAIDYNTPFTFAHTWPVLIIVFGVLKLLERMAGPPPVPVNYAPGASPRVPAPPVGYQAGAGSYSGSRYETPPPAYRDPRLPSSNPGAPNPGGTPR